MSCTVMFSNVSTFVRSTVIEHLCCSLSVTCDILSFVGNVLQDPQDVELSGNRQSKLFDEEEDYGVCLCLFVGRCVCMCVCVCVVFVGVGVYMCV